MEGIVNAAIGLVSVRVSEVWVARGAVGSRFGAFLFLAVVHVLLYAEGESAGCELGHVVVEVALVFVGLASATAAVVVVVTSGRGGG